MLKKKNEREVKREGQGPHKKTVASLSGDRKPKNHRKEDDLLLPT